jgi:hypothetical protein
MPPVNEVVFVNSGVVIEERVVAFYYNRMPKDKLKHQTKH